MWRVVSCGLIVLGLAACSATPIQQKYAERFDQLELGATEDEVRALFPDAYRGGQQTAANGKQVQALEFNDRQYDIGCDCFLKQTIHFYFVDGRLIQWGEPQDWRQREPDVVIQDDR